MKTFCYFFIHESLAIISSKPWRVLSPRRRGKGELHAGCSHFLSPLCEHSLPILIVKTHKRLKRALLCLMGRGKSASKFSNRVLLQGNKERKKEGRKEKNHVRYKDNGGNENWNKTTKTACFECELPLVGDWAMRYLFHCDNRVCVLGWGGGCDVSGETPAAG